MGRDGLVGEPDSVLERAKLIVVDRHLGVHHHEHVAVVLDGRPTEDLSNGACRAITREPRYQPTHLEKGRSVLRRFAIVPTLCVLSLGGSATAQSANKHFHPKGNSLSGNSNSGSR